MAKGQEICRTRQTPNAGEHRGEFDLPEEQIHWLTTRGDVARPLEGIWATAPYLHNGSVPTLDDLLKPEDERPICFPFGNASTTPSSWATSPSSPRCPRRNSRVSSCMTRGLPETAIEAIVMVRTLVRLIEQHSSST